MASRFKVYKAWFYRYRFLILWITFLLDFLTPESIIEGGVNNVFQFITFTLAVIAGVIILLARKKLLMLIIALGTIVIVLKGFNFLSDSSLILSIQNILQLSIYSIIIYEIFRELVDFSKVDLNTIGAVLAGFYVIGLLGGVVFALIETNAPGSFSGINKGDDVFSKLVYFSFVALTTIGFGDISPISELAQRVTVLFGLIGNFYSTIIIGIIISKFLSDKN